MAQQVTGVLELGPRGGGHLRDSGARYRIQPADAFIREPMAAKLNLRGGETIVGTLEATKEKGRNNRATVGEVTSINDLTPDEYLDIKSFEDLTAIDPDKSVHFETSDGSPSMRIIDLMTPIGFGQRGLIVAPPRTGKTVILQQMADGVAANYPQAKLIVLLIDERPEEVTDMTRKVQGEVIASSNDHDVSNHLRVARLAISKAKRLVECGKDVIILLDSVTRLGRASNTATKGGGRIMSGGLDIRAIQEPRAIFGAARNAEEGGSLTIIATALIDTGSRMDEVIFNEFKGTGNMEIVLNREMSNRRLWPAIDLNESGTRKEERLLTADALAVAHDLRRKLHDQGPVRAMEVLLDTLAKFPDNAAFVRAAAPSQTPIGRMPRRL